MKVFIHVEEISSRVPIPRGGWVQVGPFRLVDYPSKKNSPIRFTGTIKTVDMGKSTRNIFEIWRYQQELQKRPYWLQRLSSSQGLLDFSQHRSVWTCSIFIDISDPTGCLWMSLDVSMTLSTYLAVAVPVQSEKQMLSHRDSQRGTSQFLVTLLGRHHGAPRHCCWVESASHPWGSSHWTSSCT